MARNQMVIFKVNAIEREQLTKVAEHLERSRGDALRFLIRQKARELGLQPAIGMGRNG